MTVEEIYEDCMKAVAEFQAYPVLDGDFPRVRFAMPGGWGRNGRRRLDIGGNRGPVGVCVCEMNNKVVVSFNALEVLRFIGNLALKVSEGGLKPG